MRAATRFPASPFFAIALASACSADPGATGAGGGGATSTSTSTFTSTTTTTTSVTSTSTSSTASGSGSGGTGGTGGAAAQSFSMLSLNLHCLKLEGTVFTSNADRFAAIATFAAARDVAVLAVQEACRRPGEDAIAELGDALEQATGAAWSSTWSSAHTAWEGTADEAEEGLGILVRGALSGESTLVHAKQAVLRRVAVSATLPPELSGARVTSVHLDVFDAPVRGSQAREAAAAALVDTDPGFSAIVAGDFNDIEGSAAVTAFPTMGYVDATLGLDPTGIDHVMIHRATPLRPTSRERVFVGAEAVSDHPGILVRLEPATGDVVTPTRIRALFDPGAGHYLAVRGAPLPLSWSDGFPMKKSAGAEQTFVCTELTGAFSFKTLLDDAAWQSGGDVSGSAGHESVVTPSF